MVDTKHLNQTSIRIFWQPPVGNQSFEYLPTIQIPRDDSWHNQSWTSSLSQVFDNLSPGLHYRLGVYVRLAQNHTRVSRPLEYALAATLSAVPSPPEDVRARQVLGHKVEVTWRAPKTVENVDFYKVSFFPPNPAFVVTVAGSTTSTVLDFSFEPGVNYTFSVTACAQGQLESLPSEPAVLTFAKNDVLPALAHIKVVPSETFAIISWDQVASVDGYRVSWGTYTDDAYPLPWAELNTVQASVNCE